MASTLANDVRTIKRHILLEEPPEYFSFKDIARAFFGALFLASTFIFSSRLVDQIRVMGNAHLIGVIVVTFIVLTVEIYFIGYQRVENKKERPFYEFWGKRILVFWVVSLFVGTILSYLYAFNIILTSAGLVKFIVTLSFPASVGAALSDLVKRY